MDSDLPFCGSQDCTCGLYSRCLFQRGSSLPGGANVREDGPPLARRKPLGLDHLHALLSGRVTSRISLCAPRAPLVGCAPARFAAPELAGLMVVGSSNP